MITMMTMLAWAGYGDAVDGVPTLSARQMHLWTDAARVAPADFSADYAAGGCSFASFLPAEQTPEAPLRHDPGLMAVAAAHNTDMIDNNFFDHTSSDGTSFADRVWAVYNGNAIAENISSGRSSSRAAVLSGWMCSAGHRANIMNGTYIDFGGAFAASKGTENFGGGLAGPTPPVRTMAHELGSTDVTVYASYGSSVAPDTLEAVIDGLPQPMDLAHGSTVQGVYATDLPLDGLCHTAYVRAIVGGVESRFPETGSYGWGPCAFDDVDASWVATQQEPLALDPGDWVAGDTVTLTVTGAPPGANVIFLLGTRLGPGPCPAVLNGQCLGVDNVRRLGTIAASPTGEASVDVDVPATVAGRSAHLQFIVDDGNDVVLSPVATVDIL